MKRIKITMDQPRVRGLRCLMLLRAQMVSGKGPALPDAECESVHRRVRPQRPGLPRGGTIRLIAFALAAFCATGCVHRIVEPPVFVSGGSTTRASSHCNPEFEGFPCAVENSSAAVAWVAAFGSDRYSWASTDWKNWQAGSPGASGFRVPVNGSDPNGLVRLAGDAWMTYSESKNLIFAYFIGRTSNASCVAVAATSPQSLESNTWDFEAVCAVPLPGDQCAILHADSSNTFYSACSANSGIRIDAFDDCADAPGQAYGCPPTSTTQFSPSGVEVLQFDLGENSCTGNLLMPYRANGRIRLAVFDSNLQLVDDHLIRKGQPQRVGRTNTGCCNGVIRRCGMGTNECRDQTRCGQDPGDQCLAVSARPSIDVHMDQRGSAAICRAVIAYDSLIDAEDGNPWSKSRLDLLDVTDDRNLDVLARWNSTDDEFTWNHYLSYATIADRGRGKKPAIG